MIDSVIRYTHTQTQLEAESYREGDWVLESEWRRDRACEWEWMLEPDRELATLRVWKRERDRDRER